jgi:hypothetical protein
MLKSLKLFQTLTDRVIGKSSIAENPKIRKRRSTSGSMQNPQEKNLTPSSAICFSGDG